MDRKKGALGFKAPYFVTHRVLPALGLLALMVLLAVLVGCQKQLTAARVSQEMRPATQTSRLVQNAAYLRKSGHLELAVEELEKARLQKPGDLEILDLLAQCYEGLGHFERAQEVYEEALSQAGHNPALENNRCYSLYLQGRLNQAEACFRQVLSREPDNQTARNNLGLVLCRQGREAEALTLWQKDLSVAESQQLLGQALAALGREAPPHLAGLDSTPADRQEVAAADPAAPPVKEASEPQAQLQAPAAPEGPAPAEARSQSAPSPSLAAVSQDRNLTIAASNDQRPTETPRQSAAPVPAPAAATPAEQPVAKKPQPAPEPVAAVQPSVRTEPQTSVAVSEAEKEKSPDATNNSTVAESTADSPPTVTALDLWETEIELKNGNGVQNCARDLRSRLDHEGFNVVSIGNHVDFGLEKTIIAYRSEAARVARVLAQKFFPAAKLEAEGQTSPQVDIRVSLGHDLPVAQDSRYQPRQKTAANETGPQAPAAPEPTVPLKKAAKADPPSAPPTAATKAPEPTTARPPHLMRVELRNGNGVPGQARKMRRVLRGEGFKVINIGNCKDYELEETVIAYRPEAAGIAQTLSQKFFSGAHLKEKGDLPVWLDIRVLMGLDLIPDQEQLAKMTP